MVAAISTPKASLPPKAAVIRSSGTYRWNRAESRTPSSRASAGRAPERKSRRMTTVKKTTKAQIFKVERKEFFTAPVKAVVNRSASNLGDTLASRPFLPRL